MATPAQCYFCFESLAASFGGYEPTSLPIIEDLWEQHEQAKKLATLEDTDDDPNQQIAEDDCEDAEGDAVQGGVSNTKSQLSSNSSSASTPSSQSVSSGSTSITTPSSDVAGPRQQRLAERHHPLFVTWNTVSKNGNKSLRGCIGTFEAQELSAGLRSYALTSAFDDHRFNPIPESLLPSLSCSLTLLGSFEPCTNAMDWILGTHGIRISFIHRGRRYGATYLPDVPVEQGWTKEETVESLMRKAGWDGSTGATSSVARRLLRTGGSRPSSSSGKPWEQVSDFRTVKYQGLKASAGYAEWQEWRNWVLSLDDGREKLLENRNS
ncbi:AMMECR1 domain-containing protein [Aspergillus chevalieri]|uniref:AMMECR1 domain-containing protein n=1 Tax=Aspergillus chevalieri TaxID=182096 RepID=A0A7R7VIP4_ASPCH|nr:uncharacterized protein ACHE_20898S [Aspergillus chevalieri]BCR85440.1 hypothetical protein ACHE_20898S [Aspergillus chevalieri]